MLLEALSDGFKVVSNLGELRRDWSGKLTVAILDALPLEAPSLLPKSMKTR